MTSDEYIKSHWDKNSIWKNNRHIHHIARLHTCASLVKGKRFIDVGCCFGHSTDVLSSWHPGDWSGLDFSKYAVEKAKKLFPKLAFRYSEDFNLLPICGKFDSVVCSEVLEHVEKDDELVKGLLSITKDTLVMTTPTRKVGDPGHIRVYNEAMLEKLLDGTDYEIKRNGLFFYITVKGTQ